MKRGNSSDPGDMFLKSRQRIQAELEANASRPLNLEKEVASKASFTLSGSINTF